MVVKAANAHHEIWFAGSAGNLLGLMRKLDW